LGGRRRRRIFLAPSSDGEGGDSIVMYKGERVYSIFKW
jgi:hypothetical protein